MTTENETIEPSFLSIKKSTFGSNPMLLCEACGCDYIDVIATSDNPPEGVTFSSSYGYWGGHTYGVVAVCENCNDYSVYGFTGYKGQVVVEAMSIPMDLSKLTESEKGMNGASIYFNSLDKKSDQPDEDPALRSISELREATIEIAKEWIEISQPGIAADLLRTVSLMR